MKKLVPVLVIIVSLTSCKKHNAWTKGYEAKTYNEVNTNVAIVFTDSLQRKQLVQYMIKRYKQILPYGIESVPNDSLRKISDKICKEYSKIYNTGDMNAVLHWDAETEASLRNSILKRPELNSFDIKSRTNYCNCFIAGLKKIYPDSVITPIPDSIYSRVVNNCIYTIQKK